MAQHFDQFFMKTCKEEFYSGGSLGFLKQLHPPPPKGKKAACRILVRGGEVNLQRFNIMDT